MSAGWYKRRRGILEHLKAGTIGLLDLAIHDFLNLNANLIVGSDCSIPPGVCFSSAAAIYALCPREVSERTIRRSLEHLEKIGWIKRWQERGKRGNYPILIVRSSVHDMSGVEYRVSGLETTDWRNPVLIPAADRPHFGSMLSGHREERVENREKRNQKHAAATADAAQPVAAFQSQLLIVNTAQDAKLADVYPWVDRPREYQKMALWIEANRPGRKVRNPLAFCQNWFNKIPCPSTKGGTYAAKPSLNEAIAATLDAAYGRPAKPN